MHPDQPKIDLRKEARTGKWADEHGLTVVAGKIGPPVPAVAAWVHDPAVPTYAHLPRFAEWRRTKCIPRDYAIRGEHLADLDQATLELAGEVGEVAEIVLALEGKEEAMRTPEFREKLIDEIGDVFFCASWLGDAWERNILRNNRFDADNYEVPALARNVVTLERFALVMSAQAGLLANSAKKVLCQGREQDADKQGGRILAIIAIAASCLQIVEANWQDAIIRNIEKLDHRFPNGHPLLGGGIRTGKGA